MQFILDRLPIILGVLMIALCAWQARRDRRNRGRLRRREW